MQSAFEATIPLRGDLRIVVRRADSGAVHWRYEIRNTITYVALKSLVNLISQKTTSTPADFKVAYLRVGTGTTAPVRTDINLQTPAPSAAAPLTLVLGDTEKYLTVSNPTFEMKVIATLGAGDLNGLSLTEAGLFIRGGTTPTSPAPPASPALYSGDLTHYPELFARQIHPAIAKSVAFVVDYDWRVAFTA
jgi:hypothetical protein